MYGINLQKKTDMDEITIKSNIERERERQGISQTEMAERLGIDRNSYRNLEKGPTRIINSNLDKVSDILGVSTEKLVLGYEPSASESLSLHDYEQKYKSEKARLIEDYEVQLEILRTKLSDQIKINETLEKALEDNKAFVGYLTKRLRQLEG